MWALPDARAGGSARIIKGADPGGTGLRKARLHARLLTRWRARSYYPEADPGIKGGAVRFRNEHVRAAELF